MDNGWIKLHRKILENPIVNRANYLALWVILLLKANHKDNKMIWNNSFIVIKEGQFITGRDELSKQSGIPPTTVERILKYLENGHQIEQQKTTKYRLITILNWKEHQKVDRTSDNKWTTNGQQMDTNKNDNKDKNEKKNNVAETSSADIILLLDMFSKINPAIKRMYGNTTQRRACRDLIDTYGLERVSKVITGTLPKTNKMTAQFFPNISTPLQLYDKWQKLEDAIVAFRSKKLTANKIAFQ